MYTNPYQSQIDALRQQIERYQSFSTPQPNLPVQPSPQSNYNSDTDAIRNLVRQEISSLFPNQVPAQEIQQLSPQEQLLKDVDNLASSILTEEDYKFLNSPDMIRTVPVFLKSTRGKEAMSLLMQEYRSYIEGK